MIRTLSRAAWPLIFSLLLACHKLPFVAEEAPEEESPQESNNVAAQVGVNHIRFFNPNAPSLSQPADIFADFDRLGVQMFRQLLRSDLVWDMVEPTDNTWNFQGSDVVIAGARHDVVVTLFSFQYASPTPPWETDPDRFQKTLGPEAKDYLTHVIQRYKDHVRYWEIGNEMEHWRAADPGGEEPAGLPPSSPRDGFTPQEQGAFLAQVAAFVRERDPDAIIVMPGMGGLDEYSLETWFTGVLEGGGSDWFDVVNYHFYGPWQRYTRLRDNLTAFLNAHGLSDKPVWCTETGSTSSSTLTLRTDYPNSLESQAADVFRRLVQAWGAGDQRVVWHTYVSSQDVPSNDWRCYGLLTNDGHPKLAYYSYQLLTHELLPFKTVEALARNPMGVNHYRFTRTDGGVRDVVWGSGSFSVPDGRSQMTSVVPDGEGQFAWTQVSPGQKVSLTDTPVLLK